MEALFGVEGTELQDFFRASSATIDKIRIEEESLRGAVKDDAGKKVLAFAEKCISDGMKQIIDKFTYVELDAPMPLSALIAGGKKRKAYEDTLKMIGELRTLLGAQGRQIIAALPATRQLFLDALDYYEFCQKELILRLQVFDYIGSIIETIFNAIEDIVKENDIFPNTPELEGFLNSIRKTPIIIDVTAKADLESKYDSVSQAVVVYAQLLLSKIKSTDPDHVFTTLVHEVAHAIQLSSEPWKRYESSIKNRAKEIEKVSSDMRSGLLTLSQLAAIRSSYMSTYLSMKSEVEVIEGHYAEAEFLYLYIEEGFAILMQMMAALSISVECYVRTFEGLPSHYQDFYRKFLLGVLHVDDVRKVQDIAVAMKRVGEWIKNSDRVAQSALKAMDDVEREMRTTIQKLPG